jgi:hypothetical protein
VRVSSVFVPVGPEPAFVYWIRRITLLLAVGTLIFGIWWLFTSQGSADSASPAPDSSQSAEAAPIEPSSEPTAEPSQFPSESAVAIPGEAPVDCQDESIKVKALTNASTYVVGETPELRLTITNIGDIACKRDVGPKANELEITSGGYHVWSSDDCSASDNSKVIVMKPGEKVGSRITWNGRLSQKGCPGEGAVAKPGRYDVVGRNGNVESEGKPFSLIKAE